MWFIALLIKFIVNICEVKFKVFNFYDSSIIMLCMWIKITNINDNAILEEVKYSIYLSLRDSYNIKAVVFEIPNKAISSIDN